VEVTHTVRSVLKIVIAFTALAWTNAGVQGQQPSPSPSIEPAAATPNNKATTPESEPSPEADLWHRQTMTGDWGGVRSRWKEKGVELDFKLSQFYQGVTSGGVRHDDEYNGKLEMTWKFDLAKVAGWKWWSSEIKTEYRFGGPVLGGTGALNPVNTAALVPRQLGPVFEEILVATSWRMREAGLAQAYEMIAHQHNELQITEPIDEKVSEHGRHYLILLGHRFGEAIFRRITSAEIRRMGFFGGSVSQLVESDTEVSDVQLCRKLRILYE